MKYRINNMMVNYTLGLVTLFYLSGCNTEQVVENNQPNVILVMADDLGYGDLACYGNAKVKTPCLDEMANAGVRFNQFYASAPVCSPTRGSCLTGRHPYRYGIPWAGEGFLPAQEITIAEALKEKGYATGHFGKWHVGDMSKTIKQGYFPGEVQPEHYSPPWENGFDECFSTQSMMPTYNPYYQMGAGYGSSEYAFIQNQEVKKGQRTNGFRWRDHYWTGEGQIADEWLEGDDSKILMDRALGFIKQKAVNKTPFLSVIWFHTPHTPVVAGPEDRDLYPDCSIEEQHWYGAISAMDQQVGRLRKSLKDLNIDKNTIVWFCSDNGPSYIHNYNSSGGLRGKKAELYEGGIRVPAILEWPAKLKSPFTSELPASTSDFYPTVLKACDVKLSSNQPVLDGVDIFSLLEGNESSRSDYLFFQSPLPNRLKKDETGKYEQYAVIGNQFKLISMDNGDSFQLYDLNQIDSEKNDVSQEHPDLVLKMKNALIDWRQSCRNSINGYDYE